MVACKPSGKHRAGDESLCTLLAFQEAINKVRPANWKEECRSIGMIFYLFGLTLRGREDADISAGCPSIERTRISLLVEMRWRSRDIMSR
jgi:hypothetical protein